MHESEHCGAFIIRRAPLSGSEVSALHHRRGDAEIDEAVAHFSATTVNPRRSWNSRHTVMTNGSTAHRFQSSGRLPDAESLGDFSGGSHFRRQSRFHPVIS